LTLDPPPRRRLGFAFWSFITLMLSLTALFIVLGVWQVERLSWKEGLVAEVTARLTPPPVDLPPASQWPAFDLDTLSFHPVRVAGHYLAGRPILVFTSLSDPTGKYDGPGYWVIAPFLPDPGGTVFVNLGFVPQAQASAFSSEKTLPQGHMLITGIALADETPGAFTPAPDTGNHIEWVRNTARLATMAGVAGSVLGLTIDLPAGAPGQLPQGGETLVEFPNNHLGYAFTWFGFALLTPCLLAFWIYRQLRPRKPENLAP
jgi:surfeit locus 1 family protein